MAVSVALRPRQAKFRALRPKNALKFRCSQREDVDDGDFRAGEEAHARVGATLHADAAIDVCQRLALATHARFEALSEARQRDVSGSYDARAALCSCARRVPSQRAASAATHGDRHAIARWHHRRHAIELRDQAQRRWRSTPEVELRERQTRHIGDEHTVLRMPQVNALQRAHAVESALSASASALS